VAQYGNAAIDYFPLSEVAYSQFMRAAAPAKGAIFGGQNLFLRGVTGQKLDSAYLTDNGVLSTPEYALTGIPQFVHISITDKNAHIFNYNDSDFISEIQSGLISSKNYSLIYGNTEVELFYCRNPHSDQ
jgi:hypothetical protein